MSAEQPTNDGANETDVQDNISMFASIKKAAIGLGLFAIVTAGLIAVTQSGTAERIEEQIAKARSKALLEIVPANQHNNDLLNEAFWIDAKALGLADASETFVARQDGRTTALILPVVATEGYSGPIKLIVGINLDGSIKGVRVVEHKETPGLGDKIELKKSDWILSFNGRSLNEANEASWQVKKDGGDFDQLTGATITPRAIVNAVREALRFYQQNQIALLNQAPGSQFKESLANTANSNEAQ